MASDQLVALRYAKALLNSAKADSRLTQEYQDAFSKFKELMEIKQARFVLLSKGMPSSLKAELLNYALGKAPNEVVTSFVGLLLEADRVDLLPSIMSSFADLLLKEQGIAKGMVTSAYPLDPQEMDRVKKGMEKYLGQKLELSSNVSEDLLGGFVLRVGNVLVDLSLKKQLDDLLIFANQ